MSYGIIPFISVMLGDFPENAVVTLTFNSANCSCPIISI